MKKILPILLAGAALSASAASESSKPQGFRFFNNHLTIKPYVALSYTYDSNVDSDHSKPEGDSIFAVNPGIDFDWKGDLWQLAGSVYYRWNGYARNNSRLGANSYGESLSYKYDSTMRGGQRGWVLMLTERYAMTAQSDGLNASEGRGIWRDRWNLDLNGVLERRFTELLHADVQGQYSYLDYNNETGNYAPLYGWHRFSAGIEGGYVLTPWTDLLLSFGYSYYNQKRGDADTSYLKRNYSHNMDTWSAMGGIGTHLTRKIAYRLLGGCSWVNYGNAANDYGFTFSGSANWRIIRTLQTSLVASSYYQPSEYTVGQATKVYSLSWGVSYLTLAERVTLSFDLAYRHHDRCYSDESYGSYANYGEDYLTFRLGADYVLNRWMSFYANFQYSTTLYGGNTDYDYDRYQFTVGMRFHY